MIDRLTAEARRDEGMDRAAAGDGPEWDAAAFECLLQFCKVHGSGHHFLTEDVRLWAEVCGWEHLSLHREPRAWGPVIKSAARLGVIIPAGYSPANSSNRSPKCLWVTA